MRIAEQPPGTLQTASAAHEAVARRGALALDLINTQTLDRGKPRDELSSPEALARWWEKVSEQHLDQYVIEGAGAPVAWTSELLDAVRSLRGALRAMLTQVVERHAVEAEELKPVNEILALGYSALERTEQGHVKAVVRLHGSEQGSILVPIALSASRLFTEADWRRLHQCKHDRCVVFFYDTTKSGTRRWCSTGCMNRARSIQHYQRAKQKAAPPSDTLA